jgi:hypothetical protein
MNSAGAHGVGLHRLVRLTPRQGANVLAVDGEGSFGIGFLGVKYDPTASQTSRLADEVQRLRRVAEEALKSRSR